MIVPKTLFSPNFRPAGPFVVEDDDLWLAKLRGLGARDVNHDDYIANYLVPYVISMPTLDPNRDVVLRRILHLLSSHEKWRNSPLAKTPLFPNRKGELCRAVDLYNPSQPVFTASFCEDDSKFPYKSFDLKDLRKLGLNSELSAVNIKVCIESLERGSVDGDSETLWRRAVTVWKAFLDQFGGRDSLSRAQVAALAKYRFVPVRGFNGAKTSWGYRNGMPVPGNQRKALATMNELIHPTHISIAWTQKLLPEQPQAAWLVDLFDFSPTLEDVVKHLVDLATVVAPRCDIGENEFFKDLEVTYQHLSNPSNVQQAGQLLKRRYPDAPVWLNEASALGSLSLSQKPALFGLITKPKEPIVTIGSLCWLTANCILEDISYDVSHHNLHPLKVSIMPYRSLIHASGMNIVHAVAASTSPENPIHHGDFVLQAIQTMRRSEKTCDLTIIIGGRQHHVHLWVMAIFASYFRTFMSSEYKWKESLRHTLDLDEESGPGPSPAARQSISPATAESVAAVIDWMYNGRLDIDDNQIQTNDDTVHTLLDHYMNILRLADFWDIPLLKKHVENRILCNAKLFIRIDNVREARQIAEESYAMELEKYCLEFEEANKQVMQVMEHHIRLGDGHRRVSGMQRVEVTKETSTPEFHTPSVSSVLSEVVESQTVTPSRIKAAGDNLR